MKALVYHGPGQRSWDTVPDPKLLEPTDAIVRIDTATICGTDLHILKGDVPEVTPGTILGHEAVGTIVETGSAVTTVAPGDRVLVSCITSCGRCQFCKDGHYGLCTGGGGWIFGHTIDGLQAELARVPFADTSLYKVPEGLSDEDVLFLADILPTAYEVGVLNGGVQPGDTVAVVGAGPIGLATIMTAKLFTPGHIVAIDLSDARLEKALEFGADSTINNGREDAAALVMELTERARSRRRHRGGRRARDLRALHRARSPRRPCRECRRPRAFGDAASRDAVDPRHHDHNRARRREDDSAAVEADPGAEARPERVRNASVLVRRYRAAYDTFAAAAETHALKVVLTAEPVPALPAPAGAAKAEPVGVS